MGKRSDKARLISEDDGDGNAGAATGGGPGYGATGIDIGRIIENLFMIHYLSLVVTIKGSS